MQKKKQHPIDPLFKLDKGKLIEIIYTHRQQIEELSGRRVAVTKYEEITRGAPVALATEPDRYLGRVDEITHDLVNIHRYAYGTCASPYLQHRIQDLVLFTAKPKEDA